MPRRLAPAGSPDGATPATPGAGDATVTTDFLQSLLGYHARRASLSIVGVFLDRMAPFGLRPVDFSVLSVIAENPGVTSRQICGALDILPPNLVGIIRSLHERQLVLRKPHPDDGRAQGLHLSAAGQRLYRDACAVATQLEDHASRGLTAAQQRTLITLLRKVYERA